MQTELSEKLALGICILSTKSCHSRLSRLLDTYFFVSLLANNLLILMRFTSSISTIAILNWIFLSQCWQSLNMHCKNVSCFHYTFYTLCTIYPTLYDWRAQKCRVQREISFIISFPKQDSAKARDSRNAVDQQLSLTVGNHRRHLAGCKLLAAFLCLSFND